MLLSEGELQEFLLNFRKLAPQNQCAVCQSDTWQLLDRLYTIKEFNYEISSLGKKSVPSLVMVCARCGNTLLINAVKWGVVDSEISEEEDIDGEVF